MGSLSIWHWVVTVLVIASPILGIIRAVHNASALNGILSASIPFYGLVYFAITKRRVSALPRL